MYDRLGTERTYRRLPKSTPIRTTPVAMPYRCIVNTSNIKFSCFLEIVASHIFLLRYFLRPESRSTCLTHRTCGAWHGILLRFYHQILARSSSLLDNKLTSGFGSISFFRFPFIWEAATYPQEPHRLIMRSPPHVSYFPDPGATGSE